MIQKGLMAQEKKNRSHLKMATLEMIGKWIPASGNVWNCTQIKSFWKLSFLNVKLKFRTQLV